VINAYDNPLEYFVVFDELPFDLLQPLLLLVSLTLLLLRVQSLLTLDGQEFLKLRVVIQFALEFSHLLDVT
jgi:hypothetical protein